MPSKVYAISNPSAAIALRYGANVSRGIGKMDEENVSLKKEVNELKKEVKELKKK
jgi:cell division protein FtsB